MKNVTQGSENVTQSQKPNERKCNSKKNRIYKKIIELITENEKISSDKIAEIIGVTSRTIKKIFKRNAKC